MESFEGVFQEGLSFIATALRRPVEDVVSAIKRFYATTLISLEGQRTKVELVEEGSRRLAVEVGGRLPLEVGIKKSRVFDADRNEMLEKTAVVVRRLTTDMPSERLRLTRLIKQY